MTNGENKKIEKKVEVVDKVEKGFKVKPVEVLIGYTQEHMNQIIEALDRLELGSGIANQRRFVNIITMLEKNGRQIKIDKQEG